MAGVEERNATVNPSDAGTRGHTAMRVMEQGMERRPQSRRSRQIREEGADGQVSSWPRRRHVIGYRPLVGRSVEAPVGVVAEIGPDAEETVLLMAARMGHPTAFGDLVGRHAGRIRRMAFRITRNHEDAEDAIQECFKRAFVHLNSFRGQSRFSTWLTRIATNCALMKIRARRHELVPLDDSVEALVSVKYRHVLRTSLTPEERYSRRELENILADEIARLKQRFQEPVLLCHMKGLKTHEAARVLGISNSAVKARLHRARLALRYRLERLGISKNRSMHNRRVGSNFLCNDRESQGWLARTGQTPGFGD
jgi:RNA polymerase sigma-70 factor, ECF subfamily